MTGLTRGQSVPVETLRRSLTQLASGSLAERRRERVTTVGADRLPLVARPRSTTHYPLERRSPSRLNLFSDQYFAVTVAE